MFSASCLQNVCFHLVSSSCDTCDYCNHLRIGGTPCGDGVNMAEDSLPIQFVPLVRIAHKTPSLDSPVLFHREAVSSASFRGLSFRVPSMKKGKRKIQKPSQKLECPHNTDFLLWFNPKKVKKKHLSEIHDAQPYFLEWWRGSLKAHENPSFSESEN